MRKVVSVPTFNCALLVINQHSYIILISCIQTTKQTQDEILKDACGAYQKLYYEDKGLKDYTRQSLESIGNRLGIRLL